MLLAQAMPLAPVILVLLGGALTVCIIFLFRIWRGLRQLEGAIRATDPALNDAVYRGQMPMVVQPLVRAISDARGRGEERMRQAVQDRNQFQAVLSTMQEGVLVIDRQERVQSLNRAAAQMLGANPESAVGRGMLEVVRAAPLQLFLTRAVQAASAIEEDLTLRDPPPDGEGAMTERFIEANAAPLHDMEGELIGVLVVIHDVTRLRQLETVRRDFVANVSHEIKTPIAAIKAATETILTDPDIDPRDSHRFLEIIARQSDRLHALVEDVLALARIEQSAETGQVELQTATIAPVLQAAAESCSLQAQRKEITMTVDCEAMLAANINASLLEHAVVNLIDNAVKYSPERTAIRVIGRRQGGEVVIEVHDQGCGIDMAHLPRIFERFYRPDKARSRAQGGTGLGLAIVKHAVQCQAGQVSVESAIGKGSTFRIHLRG